MKTQLLITIFIALHCDAHIYFQRHGWVIPNPSYGHLHFSIDTQIIKSRIYDLKTAITSTRDAVTAIIHPSLKQRASHFLERAQLDVNDIITEFNDIQNILGSTEPDKQRTKRFLGLLVAIGSLTMSLFNQAEIIHLRGSLSDVIGKQSHIIDILQEQEIAIHTVRHDISKIRDGFLQVINITAENAAKIQIHDAEIQILMAIEETRRTITCFQTGMERLLANRIPACFISIAQIKKSTANLANRAKEDNLQMMFKQVAAIYQYETSFLMMTDQIHVFIHVPLMNTEQRMNLYKFNNAPIRITTSVSFVFKPNEKYIAIGKDGLHACITENELARGRKYGEYVISETALILNKKMSNSCLGSIHAQETTGMKEKCPAVLFSATEKLHQISTNEYVFDTTHPQTIKVECKTKITHIAIQSTQRIILEPGCEISTDQEIIRTGYDININEEVRQWPFNWNVSGNLFDIDPDTLEKIANELKLINHTPIPIRDLHKIINNTAHAKTNTIISIVITIMTLALFGIITFLLARYCILRKIQRSATSNGA